MIQFLLKLLKLAVTIPFTASVFILAVAASLGGFTGTLVVNVMRFFVRQKYKSYRLRMHTGSFLPEE